MTRNRKSQYQTLSGGSWRKARAELLSRGDAYCWRGCGTLLRVGAKRGDPDFMTLGHVTALMDGGSKYDPANIMPECEPCNYSDGARRKNAQAAGRTGTRQSYASPEWYEAYQIGTPMALDKRFDPKPTRHCRICQAETTRRMYCSTPCQREAGARQMRDRYRASQGKPIDPSKPTNPWSRTWQPVTL